MSLKTRIVQRIRALGPMSVGEFMLTALHDPEEGYYAARPQIGAAGDFITAPEISQVFGELIGLWAVETWRRMGRPSAVNLVELGPGRGALMEDLLRAARTDAAFLEASRLWLVETSDPLRTLQERRLKGVTATWISSLEAVPETFPIILVANEFLDCLPVRQFESTGAGWCERVVCAGEGDTLEFGLRAAATPAGCSALTATLGGTVVETAEAQAAVVAAVADRLTRQGGAALFIDYGRDAPGAGDTLQALKAHQRVDPLACPGEADLTAHVDFPACAAAARAVGAGVKPVLGQGPFLLNLGLDLRMRALAASRPEAAGRLERQRRRLAHPEEMGGLFKVLCVHHGGVDPPGFEDGRPPFAPLDLREGAV